MTGLSPMLACGSITFPPWLVALALGLAFFWLVAIMVAIPNVLLSCREGKDPKYTGANLVFFLFYLLLGLSFHDGAIFRVNEGFGIVSIFAVPLMAIGHFIYLFRGWRRERRAKRAAESPIQPEPPEAETRVAE